MNAADIRQQLTIIERAISEIKQLIDPQTPTRTILEMKSEAKTEHTYQPPPAPRCPDNHGPMVKWDATTYRCIKCQKEFTP